MIDPLTTLAFSIYENKGTFACLVGSGLSRAAQIPTGWEVTLNLIERIALLQGVKDQLDWAAWYRGEFKKEPNYSDLLDALTSTPDERRSVMQGLIEPTGEDLAEGRRSPTLAHRAIAKLVQSGFIRVIVTTNFDRLIERAIQDLGVEPIVIKSTDDLKGAVPIIHGRSHVIKVHGDYLDARLRNTDSELASYPPELDLFLDRVLDEFGLIICGWSGEWDGALRGAIARAPNRRYPMYWAVRGALSATAEGIIGQRDGKIIPITSADAFFEDLERLVSAQVEFQRRNPRSTALLVESVKKYLPRPECKIQLDELIGTESRTLIEFSIDKAVNISARVTEEVFSQVVTKCEARTEPLARVYGVLGRWGSNGELAEAARFIRNIATQRLLSGNTILLAMQSYPAMILMYSYGLGLLRAKHYQRIFELLATSIKTTLTINERPIVSELFLETWGEAADYRLWNWLPEFRGANKKTPLSLHLKSLFRTYHLDMI